LSKNGWSTTKRVVVAVVTLVLIAGIYAVVWFLNTARPT
jgi:hypothetical protein